MLSVQAVQFVSSGGRVKVSFRCRVEVFLGSAAGGADELANKLIGCRGKEKLLIKSRNKL